MYRILEMKYFLSVTFMGSFFMHTIFCIDPLHYSKSFENFDFRNKTVPGTQVSEIFTRSKIECAKNCRLSNACLSFAYNSVDKVCRIYDQDLINVTNSTKEYGNKYYYMIKDCHHTETSCPLNLGYTINTQICFCFKIHSTRQNYSESTQLCNDENAEMAKINRGLRQMTIMERLMEEIDVLNVYIQGTRFENTTTWNYDDGTTLSYFNWNTADGQPQNRESEDCLLARGYFNYTWHDVFEDESHSVICEI